MCPVKYYDILRDSANPFNARVKMVQYAFQFGISDAARTFGTTRDTVRKWKRLYEQHGTVGLANKSRAPKKIPHKTSKEVEAAILQHRDRLPSWGPIRLKDDFDLPVSTGAIYRILKQNGKIQKHKRKHVRKQDLRMIKMKMRTFQRIQVDVKDLSDIPKYYYFKRIYGLPRYQYTARDVKSGMLYIAHARANNCVNAANFLVLLAEHLTEHGIDLKQVTVQTDNGAEFVGNWRQRKDSLFTHMAEKVFHMRHDRIPPRRCTFNSDVESSHLRIEKDFYDLEEPRGEDSLSIKAFTYLLYFNLLRKNRAKFNKTSYEILLDEHPNIKPTITAFNPVILDDLGTYYMKYFAPEPCGQTVDYLPELTKKRLTPRPVPGRRRLLPMSRNGPGDFLPSLSLVFEAIREICFCVV
jgi:transposase